VTTGAITILRSCDRDEIAQLLERDQFFWVDVAAPEAPPPEELAEIFGLSPAATRALLDFEPGGPPSRRLHVDAGGVVFAFWCVGRPDAELDAGGGEALAIFRVNVLLHGEFILTMRERAYDLTGRVGEIPLGRSEGYAVYVVLDAIMGTLVEALAAIESRIGSFEEGAVNSSLREHIDDRDKVRNLRSRITTLRLRAGQQGALFQRVAEEVEQIETLESERHDYTRRIQGQLDRTVSRIDATSDALTNALQVKLNETTYNLTLVAAIFLPLTLIVGFFGMNFKWMTDHIESAAAFWLLGVGGMVVPLLAILLLIYLPRRQRRSRTTTGI
jgi:magnesium transporter